MAWLLLVTSLSGDHGAMRLRLWRAIKGLGAATLRDGVYLAPARDGIRESFNEQAAEIVARGGSAFVLDVPEVPDRDGANVTALFDRSAQYEELVESARELARHDVATSEAEARRALRQITREFAAIESTDFFAGRAREAARTALAEAERALIKRFSPEEPTPGHAAIPRLDTADYRECIWATREHLWIDRVASAWLIKRFIDPKARFLWLRRAADAPENAIGFDFDGAAFTHVDDRVTFEVLLESFGLQHDEVLTRIGAIVRQLDVGGSGVAEAAGIEAILTGARERCKNDDELLDDMSRTFDDLYRALKKPDVLHHQDALSHVNVKP